MWASFRIGAHLHQLEAGVARVADVGAVAAALGKCRFAVLARARLELHRARHVAVMVGLLR